VTLDDIPELHLICLMEKVPSILRHGILSHQQAERLPKSATPPVDDPLVQLRRSNKQVPGAGPLHSFANLYFHARNPMMCRIQARREELAVLRVDRSILLQPNVVIADGNASSDYTSFHPSPDGLRILSRELVFAQDWRAPGDQIRYWKQKRARCAEALVRDRVPPELIEGAYVASAQAQARLAALAPQLNSQVNADLFNI
jgi:hypothetical protein